MYKTLLALSALLLFSFSICGQSKSNETISHQIRRAHAEKSFTLSFDASANMSKLMGVSENFSDNDANAAGVRAMNFAVGFFYQGQSLAKAPDRIMLTFWVLTKKPRFAENHHWTVFTGQETLELGEARYAAKARNDMEYLNFEISRADLAKIARESSIRFRLGEFEFSFTRQQLKNLADLLILSDPSAQ
jgi:hypothetical protein